MEGSEHVLPLTQDADPVGLLLDLAIRQNGLQNVKFPDFFFKLQSALNSQILNCQPIIYYLNSNLCLHLSSACEV